MSTCAVMLVKDEADVIEHTLRHLAYHVDEIIVADNLSTDGTTEILRELARELPLHWGRDGEAAHYQGRKTTELAQQAAELGHYWVVPCDADEVWYVAADVERRVADYLAGQSPDVQIVSAELYHHLPTALDPLCERCGGTGVDPVEAAVAVGPPESAVMVELGRHSCSRCGGGKLEPNPYKRIGYRNIHRGGLPKVACRLRDDLVIHEGNHGASTTGTGLRAGGLCVRHFSWRSAEQYARKLANGYRALAATDLPSDVGEHWRKYDPDAPDFEALAHDHFRTWFYSENPARDRDLMYDPAPVKP